MAAIEAYRWPGNIRQLHNALRVAIALLDEGEDTITELHLPEELFEVPLPLPVQVTNGGDTPTWLTEPQASGTTSLEEIGRQAALRAMEAAGGNISAAARRLGISRNTLYRKLGKL